MITVAKLVMKSRSLTLFIFPLVLEQTAKPAGVLDGFPIPDVGAVLTRSACVYDRLSFFRSPLSPRKEMNSCIHTYVYT